MKVVSNTSPLVFLHHVDSLDLLASCFDQVFVPEAVVSEFGQGQLSEMVNVHQKVIKDKTFVNAHYGALHRGELETIQLALELNADFVLLDDLLARKKAKMLNVQVIGTLGVFLFAARKGYIAPIVAEQKIDILVQKHAMYVAAALLKKIKIELRSLP